jgi:hypothetical protein
MRVQTRPRRACLQEPHPARRWPRCRTRPRRACLREPHPARRCLQEPHPARRWPRCRTHPRRACLREPHPALCCLQQPHALATAQFAARVSGKSMRVSFYGSVDTSMQGFFLGFTADDSEFCFHTNTVRKRVCGFLFRVYSRRFGILFPYEHGPETSMRVSF